MACLNCNKDVPIENKDTGLCASCNKKARDADENYAYARALFLDSAIAKGTVCPLCGAEVDKTFDIHHRKGRVGYADQWARDMDIPLLVDMRFFIAVDRPCHQWIETHPLEAKKKGLSVSRLAFTPSPVPESELERIKAQFSKGSTTNE